MTSAVCNSHICTSEDISVLRRYLAKGGRRGCARAHLPLSEVLHLCASAHLPTSLSDAPSCPTPPKGGQLWSVTLANSIRERAPAVTGKAFRRPVEGNLPPVAVLAVGLVLELEPR